ncbi:MAG: hypothetical protein JKY93_12715, partial [Gammaproteobacteria bacterium]|nr:hypothetical protein [Gammaproteobacteria bacterium]
MRSLFLVVLLVLGGCSDSTDFVTSAGQLSFADDVGQLSADYDAALDGNNEHQIKAVEERYQSSLKKSDYVADNWLARVDYVGDDFTIETQVMPYSFQLMLFSPDAVEMAKQLSKGDLISFSGSLGGERSITVTGGIGQPEFKFFPTMIKKQGGVEVLQDVAAHTGALVNAKKQDDAVCEKEVACIGHRYVDAVILGCLPLVEKKSIYSVDWKNPLLNPMFSRIADEGGKLLYSGDSVTFGTKAGAAVNMVYTCSFHPETKAVELVRLAE